MKTLEEIYGQYTPPKLVAEPQPQVQPYQYQQYGAGQYINPQTNQQELAEAWDYIFKDKKQQAQPQAQQVNVEPPAQAEIPLWKRALSPAWDIPLDVAQGFVSLADQGVGLFDPQSSLREYTQGAYDWLGEAQTDDRHRLERENALRLQQAKENGDSDWSAHFQNVVSSPTTAIGNVLESVAPVAIGTAGAVMAAPASGGGSLLAIPTIIGAVQGAGSTRNEINDSIMDMTPEQLMQNESYRKLVASGVNPQDAQKMIASSLTEHGGAVAFNAATGAILSRLGAAVPLGKAANALKGVAKTPTGRFVRAAASEAVEEPLQGIATDWAINDINKQHSPFENIAQNTIYGAIGGGLGGGIAAYDARRTNGDEPSPEQNEQPADPSTAQGLADNITTNAYTAPERTETQQERKVKANGKALNEILTPFNENEEKYNGYHDDLINDIADGTINESAKQPTEYGRLAKEYLVKTGQYQQEPVQQEQPKQPKVFTGPVIEGTNDEVDIGDNEYQPFTYTLMEADDLDPTVNKSSNQYRDRNRQSSNAQVQNIANNLDPRKVGASPTMDYGSPVIANDNQTIIAGNGRTMAINQAYGLGKAENYRQDLVNKANEYGFSPEQVGQFKKPVLVRKLNNDVDVRKTAIRSNEQGGLRMSSLEQAKVDAERLPDIANIEGDLTNPSNRSYVNQFIQNQPENLRNEYLDSKGQLSQTGVTRLRNAILHKAYGDTDILNRAVESADQQQKNILNALTQVASKVAKTKDSVAQGNLDPNADISQDIINAVDKFNQAKLNGKTIEEYINQQDFVSEMSPTEKQLLRLFGENNRSAKKIATTLNNFYRVAESKANTQQASMFGDVEFNPAEELVNAENIDEDLLSTSEGKSDREVLEDLLGKEVADKIEFVAPDSPMPRGENLKSLVDKGVEGWFNPRTNKIYLVAESIQANGILNRQERLAWVATHELAHAGVKNRFSNLLNNVLNNARSHLLVKGIADKIKKDRANRGLPIDDMVATEEALVELYAAVKTGKWDELENRYGIKIHNSWRTGERSVEPLLNRVANVLKRLMSQVIGRPITDEEVFTILSGIEKGIDTYAKSGRDTDGNGEVKYRLNDRQKEQRGIYNVSFNDKKSTQIKKDLEDVSKAIKYEKGFEDRQRNVGFGSLHIEKHLDPQKDGFVTSQELVNMGDIIRNVEPYESRGKRVYEYTNDKGVTFKVIVGNKRNGERVISFYSNRRVGEENDTLPYIYSNPSNENNNAQSGISQDESLNKDEKFSTSQNNSSQDLVANAIDEGKTLKEIQEDKNILRAVAKDIEPEYEEFLNSDSNHKLMKNMRRRFLNAWKNDDFSRENGSHVLEGIIKEHYNGHKESNPTTNDLVQKAVDERREITSLRADEKFLDDFADALTRENNKVIASDTSTDTEKKVAKYYNEWLAKDSTIDNSYLIKEIENRYYKAEAERAKAKPKEVVKEKAPIVEEKPKRRFNENASPKELDKQYFKALNDGDNELAQQIVDFMAEKKGYDTSDNFRMDHKAPSSKTDDPNALNIMEHDLIPNDLWEHPEHYVNREDMPTFYDVKRFLDRVEKYKRGELDKMPRMIVYRAVPKDLKESEIRNGDWVTPSLDYAKFHGVTNVGKYRIIKKAIPADQVYWNGDSIQEWGVDDSKSYAYKNTKNNRKLADLETRDDDGEIIPPSKRFNARKDDIRFSVADKDYKRDLVVTHNISADGIIHADKMGGLPFASIAVTKQDNPLTGFGEVTLIGDRNYIDPKGENKAKVFGSDIYSPRYPNVRYKIKTKDLVKLYKNFSKTAREVNDTSFDYHFSEDNILDKGVRDTLLNSEAVKYQFLKDEGVAPDVIYKEGGISQYGPTAIKIAKENLEIDTGLVKDYAQERIKTLKAQKERRVANAKARNMPEEKINGYIERADKSINNYQKVIDGDTAQIEEARFELEAYVDVVKDELSSEPTIDNVATLKAINEKVKEREDDFVSYVDDIADDVDQQEVLYNGTNSRGAPTYQKHTLENVVKKLKKDLRGGENATYNIGSLRGKVTPKFKSIEDIQRNKERLVGSEDFERVKGEVSREIEDSGEKLDLNLDETLELLDDVIDNGVPKAFKNQGVDNTPKNRNIIKDILAKLENMPTEYFEGKAKEVTQFSDFKGAVIPDNLKSKARKILENAGLKLFDYKAGDQDSRAKAIKSATNKLDEESGDVLFSVAGNKEFEDTAKKYGGEQAYEQAVDNGDTELNYKQWVQVRTPSFKNWFGDWENDPENSSQVVNEETGEPLVVYHGSGKWFTSFNDGKVNKQSKAPENTVFATSDREIANSYISGNWYGESDGENSYQSEDVILDENSPLHQKYDWGVYRKGGIYPIFMNIRDPQLIDFKGNKWTNSPAGGDINSNVEEAMNDGYDGLIAKNIQDVGVTDLSETPTTTDYVAFNPNQIKSATDNKGEFNPDNDDIRFSTGKVEKQSASDLAKTGKAIEDESLFNTLKSKDGRKSLFEKVTSTLDEHITDALRPVNDWMKDSVAPVVGEVETQNLQADMYLAKGKRDTLVKDIENRFLKPLLTSLAKVSKKYKLDELTTKRLVGYWASARYSIDKNLQLLEREKQAMDDAEKEYQDIRLQYDLENQNDNVSDETQALLDNADNEYRKAKRQYEYRKHDVELGLDSDEKFKVGTAGGWSIAQAKQIMRNIEKHISKDDLLNTTKHLYRLNQHRLDIDRAAGRYTEEQYREMKLNKHYVPLTGDPNGDVFDSITGAGDKAVNVSKDKALKGRKNSEAEDAIDASWKGISNSATYAGWADFKQDIDDIYQTEFDRLIDEGMTDKQAKEEIKETLGITKSRMLGVTRPNDNVLIRKHGGVYYQYELPPKVMRALKNDNVETLNAFFDLLAKPTRAYARGVTQWKVHFAPMNMLRDLWEKSEFIRVQKIYDKNGKLVDSKTLDKIGRDTIRNALTPTRGVLNATRKFALGKGDTSTPEGKMLQDLIDFGGVSTYRTYLDHTEKDLIKKVKKENGTFAKRLDQAGNIIEGYNAGFDLVSSLASYKALVENGVAPKQAAAVTLELTNFRKQGASMKPVKALYMFAQPTAMGGRNLAKYLSTPKGRKRFLGYMVAMSAMYAMLNSFTDDEDDLDLLGDITRYIPIPTGDGEFIKIPVGFGMPQLAWNFSVNMSRLATGAITPSEAISNMSEQVVRSGFPISPSSISASENPLAKFVLTVTPSTLQPVVQNALNKNAFGSSIHSNFGNNNKVRADQGKATTPEFWKDASHFVLDNFGMNIYPEDMQNIARGYAGMLGSLSDIQTLLIDNPNREKLGRPTRTPIFNQLYGSSNVYAIPNLYYQASEEARGLANRVKSQTERGLKPKLTPLEQKELKWFKVADRQEKAKRSYKSKLTRRLNSKKLSQAKYDELLTNKRKQMEVLQKNLLNSWREMHDLKTY